MADNTVYEKTTTTTASSAHAHTHNPEALDNAPHNTTTTTTTSSAAPARFQNVDVEQGRTTTGVTVTTAPVVATTTTSNVVHQQKTGVSHLLLTMDWGLLNLILFFTATLVFIAASILCGGGGYYSDVNGGYPYTLPGIPCRNIPGYQVAVGVISAFIALVCAILYHFGFIKSLMVMELISLFQFLWWTAGVIVLTFFGSFQNTQIANGYFGAWGSFIVAALLLMSVSTHFTTAIDRVSHSVRKPLLFLIAASAVEMGAAIGPCSPRANCVRYNAWALSMGTISLFISIVLFFIAPRISLNILRLIGYFLVVWWVVGMAVVTFGGPFIGTANGYFASLAAVFASFAFVHWVNAHNDYVYK